jgi:hypothetical protein
MISQVEDDVERRCTGGPSDFQFLVADVDKGGTDFEIALLLRSPDAVPLLIALKSDQTRLPLDIATSFI